MCIGAHDRQAVQHQPREVPGPHRDAVQRCIRIHRVQCPQQCSRGSEGRVLIAAAPGTRWLLAPAAVQAVVEGGLPGARAARHCRGGSCARNDELERRLRCCDHDLRAAECAPDYKRPLRVSPAGVQPLLLHAARGRGPRRARRRAAWGCDSGGAS